MALGAPVATAISAPPIEPLTTISVYGAGNTLTYSGWAKSDQGQAISLGAVTSFSAANPGVMTFTAAHGLNYDATDAKATALPLIAISGGTGNWAAVNGIWVFKPTSTTAGNIQSVSGGNLVSLNTTGFGAVTGTLAVYTRSPRTSDPVWAIQYSVYTPAGVLIWSGWPANVTGAGSGDPSRLVGGSSAMSFVFDSRALYAYQ